MPDVTPIVLALFGGGALGGIIAALLGFIGSRRRNIDLATRERDTTIGERVDDGISIADRIRDEVTRQVEEQMRPIREKMAKMESESHEMNNAVRANVTRQWFWDKGGRDGELPMLDDPVLERLGLGHLIRQHIE